MSGRLSGKTAVIVGAGQSPGETIGNGRAASVLFAREGANVFLVDRDLDSARETAAMIEQEGFSASVFRADISDEQDCIALAQAAQETLGRIDVLHNNVGILGKDNYATELEEENWQQLFDVNLKGMWMTCKHVIPLMREQGHGAISNVSSIGSLMLNADLLGYSLTNLGVNGLTQAIALENAPHGIRVNAVLPGIIDTPLGVDAVVRARGMPREKIAADRDAAVPMGRQGTAWDIAHAALFLDSDDAGHITGQLLTVDGGTTLRVGALPLRAYGAARTTPDV